MSVLKASAIGSSASTAWLTLACPPSANFAANCLFLDILTTLPRLHPFQPLLLRAIDISSALRIGVYDCVYVALAELEQCALVTADDKLLSNVQSQFPFARHLKSLP